MKYSDTKPAIAIIAFDRPRALARLLNSLSKADCPHDTTLVISIDGSEKKEVNDIASNYNWHAGEKKVIRHSWNVGLREHVLKTADLVSEYKNILLLEDDLYVSPYFYSYIAEALRYYGKSEDIAGISLYSHSFNETARLKFTPVDDGKDVFFLKLPSSWGQCWTEPQWDAFRRWYDKHADDKEKVESVLPPDIRTWPESSWKKYFASYMNWMGRYFVYPRTSLVTNLAELGTHTRRAQPQLNNSIPIGDRTFRFTPLQSSLSVYDSYCEIEPWILKRTATQLKEYNFSVDIYGKKPLSEFNEQYVLTSRTVRAKEAGFELLLRPPELNVMYGIEGCCLSLARKNQIMDNSAMSRSELVNYYHALPEEILSEWERKYNLVAGSKIWRTATFVRKFTKNDKASKDRG